MATIDAILGDLPELPTRNCPPSYTNSGTQAFRVGLPALKHRLPDVTAIILNWSRLDNVIRIVSLLCGPWLDDTISEVYIWNNSPQKLSNETFAAHCNTSKLRIENSPSNLYFYARFLACTKASTPYCFIQDDDYIILPELIKTLRIRVEESLQGGIYLLPPDEHLSSRLRRAVTSNGIHTGFAWLGYGAMIKRQEALDFLSLLHDNSLAMTEEEIKMADNYFTILCNQLPEVWFNQGIELGGGQPFTVGHEGSERNLLHIENACRYLDGIITAQSARAQVANLGFVKIGGNSDDQGISRAPAVGASYLLESNIRLLPEISQCQTAMDLLGNEKRSARSIGQDAILHYQRHPLSCAVDGNTATMFCSPYNAKQGDYILVDILSTLEFNGFMVELVLLVPEANERILHKSKYEHSCDGKHWVPSPYRLRTALLVELATEDAHHLVECSVQMDTDHARFYKATVVEDVPLPWVIHGAWVRSVRA